MTERTRDPRADDERFEQRLVEIHEALAAGAPPAESVHNRDADLDQAVQPVENVLKLIERVRRRERSDPDAAADTSQNAAGLTQLPDSVDPAEETPSPVIEHLPARLGRFEFIRQLGQGGGGIVLLAHDPDLKRDVALKVPRPEALITAEARSRFLREAEAAAALNHPHIVPVFEAGTDGPLSYIVSAYCNGTSLAEWLREHQPPLDPRVAAELTATLADAVQHAHSRGILHRDLKPANVLLESSDPAETRLPAGALAAAARISDFGLARIEGADGGTQTGSILGTPSYMSPEQAQGDVRHVGAASDVYSLGAILYELLTGRPPFREGSILETLQAVRLNDPVPPHRLRADVPSDLEAICLKCLEKQPERRYASAAALADDLRSFLEGRPVVARPVGKLERGWRWCRRNPLPAALILLAGLAMLGGTGVSTYFAIQADAKAGEAVDFATDADDARQEAVDAQQELVDELYYHRIALAEQEWKANNVARARELLDACLPDQRRWEWYYLRRMIETGYKTLTAHEGPVLAVAYNSDGSVLASGGQDGRVVLWDGESAELIDELVGNGNAVQAIAFHPSLPHLAAAIDREIVIWDWPARRQLRRWHAHSSAVLGIDYSAHGELLGSEGADRRLVLWDPQTGEEVNRLPETEGLGIVRFARDGRRLATAGRTSGVTGGPIVWDYEAGQASPASPGHESGVRGIDFSSAGDRVATVSFDGMGMIWSAENGERLVTLHGQEPPLNAVRFSPDDRWIAAAGHSNAVWIWDSSTGRLRWTLRGHTSWINDLSYHPDGEKIASAGDDGTICIWDVVNGQQFLSSRTVLDGPYRPRDLTFSPDGRWLALGLRDREFLGLLDTRTLRGQFTGFGHEQTVWQSVFTPDGAYLASASDDSRVIIRNTVDFKPLHVLDHGAPVGGLAITADGSRLISAAGDTVRIWSMPDGRLLRSFSHPTLTRGYKRQSIAVTPDGQTLYSAGHDANIRAWDLSTGRLTAVLEGHALPINDIALDRTGRWLVSGGEDRIAKLWRTADGKPIRDFPGNTQQIASVVFSRDGRRVFTGSADDYIRIWETDTGRLILKLGPRSGYDLALSSDGHRLASSAGVGDYRIWNAEPLSENESNPLDDPLVRAGSLFHAARLNELYEMDQAESLRLYHRAINAFTKLHHEAPEDEHVRLQLSKTQLALSNLLDNTQGDPAEIRQLLDAALSLAQELVTDSPDDIRYLEQLGLVSFKLASVTFEEEPAECEGWLQQSIRSLGRVASVRPLAIDTGSYLRRSYWRSMELLAGASRAEEAIEAGLEALAIEESLRQGHEDNPLLAASLKEREKLQELLRETGRVDEADRVQYLTELVDADDRARESFQRGQAQQSAGDNAAAIDSYRIAIDAGAVLLADSSEDRALQFRLARAQMALGNILQQPREEAIEVLTSAVAIFESLVNADPGNTEYLQLLGISCHLLGARYVGVDTQASEEGHRRAIALMSGLFATQTESKKSHWAYTTFRWSHWSLMEQLSAAGRLDEAIECGLQAVAIEETSLDDDLYPSLIPSLSHRDRLDALLREAGRLEEAATVQLRADELRPPEEMAAILFARGEQQQSAHDFPAAIEWYRRAADEYADLVQRDPDSRQMRFEHARALVAVGNLLRYVPRPAEERIGVLTTAVSILEPLVDAEPDNTSYQERFGVACHILGVCYSGVDAMLEEQWCRRSIDLLSGLLARHPDRRDLNQARSTMRWTNWHLMYALSAAGRADEAIECGLQAVAIEDAPLEGSQRPPLKPHLPHRERLKTLLREAGRIEDADAVQQRIDELRTPADRPTQSPAYAPKANAPNSGRVRASRMISAIRSATSGWRPATSVDSLMSLCRS